MYASAGRATPYESTKDKGGAAATAKHLQSTIGNRALPELAAVGLGNEFNQISAFGKGTCTGGMAASAIAHDYCSCSKMGIYIQWDLQIACSAENTDKCDANT
jgi:hypothetical protein